MKSIKESINEAQFAKPGSIERALQMSKAEGSVGYAIRELQDKLNDINNEKDLDEFVKVDIQAEIDPKFAEDYELFTKTYNKQKGLGRKYRYVFGYTFDE